MLALTMVPGLGPIRIAKLIETLGSPQAVLGATTSQFARVPGIGNTTAANIAQHLHRSIERVDEALEKIARVGAHVVSIGDPQYPPMLAQTPSAPPILMVRGHLDHAAAHKYTVSIVGSRSCSVYGSEQATRFGHAFASAGLTVVSGGARGIDTCAHRGALSGGGSTIVVMGCGLSHAYPPENANLFDEVVSTGGAIVSELPVHTPPDAKNFPGRNRIISGLSLGVVVIEAGLKSGALITARHANEDHGREVMGVPGRIDSPASAGSNQLLKDGAHLVTDPSDVISILERDAYHLYSGSHEAKTKVPTQPALFDKQSTNTPSPAPAPTPIGDVDDATRALLEALGGPRTGDELAERLGLNPGDLRSKLTMLEIQGRVQRAGSRFKRVR